MAMSNAVAESNAATPSSAVDMKRLEAVLQRFEVHIADANDLVALQEYRVVIIADDSGSMGMPAAPPQQRRLGDVPATRWDELKETTGFIVDIAASFDPSGVDICFLNRGRVPGVKSSTDRTFVTAFGAPPSGSTPLTEALRSAVSHSAGERPVLLFIMTDGVPNDGPRAFSQELRRVVKRQSTTGIFKVQIMQCTPNDDEVSYLNDLDAELAEIDCTDDYYNEKQQVLRAGLAESFSRGDWCIKAMLGPICRKFDKWDESLKGPRLEGACPCTSFFCF